MRKILLLFVAFAVFGVSACSGSAKSIASVNGSSISLADVEAMSPADAAVATTDFDANLRNLIIEKVVEQGAQQKWNITLDPTAIDDKVTELLGTIGADDASIDESLTKYGITRDTVRHIAVQQLLSSAVSDQLATQVTTPTEEDLQAAYDANKDAAATACVHHILVATEAEANDVIARLDAGESFADVAAEVSTDTGSAANGGDLGCVTDPNSKYVPEFAQAIFDAPIGEVYGPVQTDYGYHVLIVDSLTIPTFDEMKSDLSDQIEQTQVSDLFSNWIMGQLDAATIDVSSKYGTWVGSPDYTVNPPA